MSKNLYKLNDDEARLFLEGIRWPEGPICPHCGSDKTSALNGKSCRKGLKKCKNPECRKQFTVTVGTIFERSHVPLSDWVCAFARMCASKKGISALQLSRELGCEYKTAWFMCHRIREAMRSDVGILGGEGKHVEVDETYVGGKPRKHSGKVRKRGRGTSKTPVLALVERDGNVKTKVIANVDAKKLRKEIFNNVAWDSTLCTDEANDYTHLGRSFPEHLTVNHSQLEYATPAGAGINSAESFFALIKRGVYGTFHNVSKKHLHRYCDEFAFRWNTRKTDDGVRTVSALMQAEGKRLTYRQCD